MAIFTRMFELQPGDRCRLVIFKYYAIIIYNCNINIEEKKKNLKSKVLRAIQSMNYRKKIITECSSYRNFALCQALFLKKTERLFTATNKRYSC